MNRKPLPSWRPLILLALVLLTPLRPIVLNDLQRGLLATDFWKAEMPVAAPTATLPMVLTAGACPHRLPLVTLDGKAVDLSDLKGHVVFVNLWASWCPPCQADVANGRGHRGAVRGRAVKHCGRPAA